MSIVSTQQLAAFHATEYYVDIPGDSFVLRIGTPSPALQRLHQTYGVTSSAYLTAWNPLGEIATPEQNAGSQAALARDLDDLDVTTLPGEGKDPASGWAEQSLLALGLPREQAVALGSKYRQLAIVFSEEDAVPQLVTLR
jgi:hypothetical protein